MSQRPLGDSDVPAIAILVAEIPRRRRVPRIRRRARLVLFPPRALAGVLRAQGVEQAQLLGLQVVLRPGPIARRVGQAEVGLSAIRPLWRSATKMSLPWCHCTCDPSAMNSGSLFPVPSRVSWRRPPVRRSRTNTLPSRTKARRVRAWVVRAGRRRVGQLPVRELVHRAAGHVDRVQILQRTAIALSPVVDGLAVVAPIGFLGRVSDPVRVGHDLLERHAG